MLVGFHVNKSFHEHADRHLGKKEKRERKPGHGGKKRETGHGSELAESLAVAADVLENLGFSPIAQIFVHGPRDHHPTVSSAEIEKLARLSARGGPVMSELRARPIKLIVHGAYPDYPWKKNPAAIAGIRGELRIVDELGAAGLVIHLGQEAASRETLLDVLSRIDQDLRLSRPRRIFLETNVVAPDKAIFSRPAELGKLMRAINSRKFVNIKLGLCLDTAHLHSCGVRLGSRGEVEKFLEKLPGSAKYLLHLNDSALELGSGRDQHERLGGGHIWGRDGASKSKGKSGRESKSDSASSGSTPALPILSPRGGLKAFLTWAKKTRTPIILERHPADLQHDLELCRKLLAPA